MEKVKRNTAKRGRYSETTSKNDLDSSMKVHEWTFKEFVSVHDSVFAFYPDVPSSPRIRVSLKPQHVQTHDVEVLGEPSSAGGLGGGPPYSNMLLRQLAQQYTVASKPPIKNSNRASSSNRSLLSLISPAQIRNRDKQRISRLVQLIRSEAKCSKLKELSSSPALAWLWICGYTCNMTPASPSLGHTMFLTSIGRILAGLDSAAVWKLSFVKSPLDKKGILVKVIHTNRNVSVEAEERSPNVFPRRLMPWRRRNAY